MLVKLKNYLDVKRGPSLPSEFYSEKGTLIRLTLGNFNYPNGGFKQNTSKKDIYYTGPVRDEYILNEGDLITPLTEQVVGLLGETAWIPESNKYIQNGDIGLVIPINNKLDKKYCYYLLSSPLIKKQLSAGAQQTKIRHTSPDKIKDCVVPIPNIDLQRKIGNLLYMIDEQIKSNSDMVEKLQVLAQSIYSRWFIQFDFPNAEGKPYLSSGGKMVFNKELKREIPEGWKVKKLKDLLYKVNRVFDYSIEERTIDLSVMPNNSFFINEVNSSKNFSTNLFSMKSGDILFGSIRPYLKKAGIAPCDGALAGTVHCLNVYNKFDYNFCLLTLCSDNLFNYACKVSKGTKMPVISCEDLLEYPVAYNIDVIKKFFDVSLKEFVPCLAMENQKLYSLKKTIMPLLINQQLQ